MLVKMSAMRSAYVVQVIAKATLILLALLVVSIARSPPWEWLQNIRPLGRNPDPFCLYDHLQHVLQQENIVIRHKTGLAYTLQLLSSLMIDFAFLNSCITWIASCSTGRLYWAILFFYSVRALIQVLTSNVGNFPI